MSSNKIIETDRMIPSGNKLPGQSNSNLSEKKQWVKPTLQKYDLEQSTLGSLAGADDTTFQS